MNRPSLLLVVGAPLWLGLGCASDPAKPGASEDDTGQVVTAVVDPARPTHYFDMPFPSDDLLGEDMLPDLSGYPVHATDLALPIIEGWRARLEMTANGFGNLTPAYFRFTGPITAPESTDGTPDDSVLLIDMDTGELIPLTLTFTADAGGDPYLANHLLALAPALGHPPRSGARLAAVVTTAVGAQPPAGWTAPDGLTDALSAAEVTADVAVATVYTIQDGTDQLRQLVADADARIGETPDWGDVNMRRVTHLAYSQGTTPSGNEATVLTVTFEDGTTELSYQSALDEDTGTHDVDMDAWPMVVFQAEVPVWNYSGLEDRPYMNPGVSHLGDSARMTGWIDFVGGQLVSEPDLDTTRVTISLPKDSDGQPIFDAPVLMYDHGTGGTAYHAVQRRNKYDRCDELARIFQEEGWAVVGRDQPLYGTRYPLMDEGYGASLGFYNIVNLPAFRDNQRQGAIEAHQVRRFIENGLNDAIPTGSVDGTRVRRLGHSLGSVTLNIGTSVDPDRWEKTFLSGTGGVFSHYFLDTGLIDGFDPALLNTLFGLFGADVPEVVTASAALGAALGLPDTAWPGIDRMHPVVNLFQWTMDPSDPMALARDQSAESLVFLGVGDYQVPNFTTEALHEALPNSELVVCEPTSDYDGHWCLHREPAAWVVFQDWLASD